MAYMNSSYMNAVWATVTNLIKPKIKLNALMLKNQDSYVRKDKQWEKNPGLVGAGG